MQAAAAGAEADLVSESVPEDPKLKASVFAQFNALCPERTVFTTNTSSLLPSMFAEATGRPELLCAIWEPRARLLLGASLGLGSGSLRRILEEHHPQASHVSSNR